MDSPDIPKLHGSNLKETWPDFWVDASFKRVSLMGANLKCNLSREHHMFHAALAYYFSPFDSCVSFACDPVGAEAYFIRNGTVVPAIPQRHLVAPTVYALVSERLFGSSLIGAGKLMALAPFGSDDRQKPDYAVLSRMAPLEAYNALVNLTTSEAIEVSESGKTLNASLAWHVQSFLEFELSQVMEELYETCTALGVEANLCLSGGIALNSVANQRCFERSPFRELYLHPACGDDGTAIGAALVHWHLFLNRPRIQRTNVDAMYSCRTYEHEIPNALRSYRDQITIRESNNYIRDAAELIASGHVVGWYQGASEIGPRALGNRSILADPRNPTMKAHLNCVVKQRESFRPFAPSILVEHSNKWFGIPESPFMLRIARLKGDRVSAISHVDGSARFQTVSRNDNATYYDLIGEFLKLTDVPMVLNTSFNGKSEPIVESPQDAVSCMIKAKLDALIFPGLIVTPRNNSRINSPASAIRI